MIRTHYMLSHTISNTQWLLKDKVELSVIWSAFDSFRKSQQIANQQAA